MKTARILLSLSLLAIPVPPLEAAPISFNTALPVHEGGMLFRGQGVWMRMHNDPSPMGREMDVAAVPSVLVYGVSSKLALMGVFPYMDKRLAIKSTGAVRRASGLGDIMTVGRYEIFARSSSGQTTRGAVFAGLKWPSGRNTESDALGVLPPSVQLGSGSYDPMFGTVWTGQWLAFQADADISYRRNTKADDFKFGDALEQNVSLQYRIWPRVLQAEGLPNYLYGVLEANNVYQAKNEAGGVTDGDSGGYQLFLTPGLQWVTKRAVFEFAAQLPAVQSLNGTALRTDYRLLGSFRLWF
ncbi:MAG: transporter [Elusimicrobia bacterium]|nr:transporter [Elusimicrobiota bacterium]